MSISNYNINIIIPRDGWILEKIGVELNKRISESNLYYTNSISEPELRNIINNNHNINYYINYNLFRHKSSGKDLAFFTHIEEDTRNLNLIKHFYWAAKEVDGAVFMTPKYLDLCKTYTKSSRLIIPGYDDIYKTKLNLGIVGRSYSNTSRKNLGLAELLKKIEWLNIEHTEGLLPEEKLPDFYRKQDYILVVSTVEGGPMCVIESLAMGKEVIFPRGVGFGNMFEEGIHYYEKSDPDSLISMLRRLFKAKLNTRQLVEKFTWDYFAEEHIKYFNEITALK